jgi:hypothetical protein
MADSILGNGRIQNERFEFTLDGLATANQMNRLLKLTADMTAKITKDSSEAAKKEKEYQESLDKINDKTKDVTDSFEDLDNTTGKFGKSFKSWSKVSDLVQGDLKYTTLGMTGSMAAMATSTGVLVGMLSGYADQLQSGMQRGISGGVMDFAIAAKTGGVSLGAFSKALEESGGAFASLGEGATDGAKNFGALISGVRTATASVGNLGLSNDQLALLTAQQVKVAVSQGFKGKAAQDVVIRNTGALAKELDTLANQTGKSVLEMTQAAVKLAQDPLVSSFVRDIKLGGADAAKALNSYAANFSALFGKEGDKLARDTIGPALAGLPMIINDTGKNLALASQSTYNEIDRLAQKARKGEAMTDDDRKRLSETIKKEVAQRGQELRYMAELGGPMGESAKQFLALAQQVEDYNSAAGEQRRKEDKTAQEFNTAMNQFKANVQALTVPFLKLINGIDWTLFINVMSSAIEAVDWVLHKFDFLGKVLGFGPGALIGLFLGVGAVLVTANVAYKLLNVAVKDTAKAFVSATAKINAAVQQIRLLTGMGQNPINYKQGGPGGFTGPTMYEKAKGRMGKGMELAGTAGSLGGLLGTAGGGYAGEKLTGRKESNAGGSIGTTVGGIAGGAVGSYLAGGLTVGTLGLGSFLAPAIITATSMVGATIGNVIGNTLGDWMSEDSSDLAETDIAAVDQNNQYQQASLKQGAQLNAKIDMLNENMGYSNSIGARGVAVAETGNRQLANLQYGNA